MRMVLLFTASLVAAAAGAQDATDSSAALAGDSGTAASSGVAPAGAAGAPAADSEAGQATNADGGNTVKTLSGMSVLGNEEAPKSLVIVPWKSSRLGDGLGIGNALDESPRAVDREVFMRELHFYELRSGSAE